MWHTKGLTFYHKGPLPPVPETVHKLRIEKREAAKACGSGSMTVRVEDFEHADQIVVDLDPGEGMPWEA